MNNDVSVICPYPGCSGEAGSGECAMCKRAPEDLGVLEIVTPAKLDFRHMEEMRIAAEQFALQVDLFIRGYHGERSTRNDVHNALMELLEVINE
jgi:hypothetical protein